MFAHSDKTRQTSILLSSHPIATLLPTAERTRDFHPLEKAPYSAHTEKPHATYLVTWGFIKRGKHRSVFIRGTYSWHLSLCVVPRMQSATCLLTLSSSSSCEQQQAEQSNFPRRAKPHQQLVNNRLSCSSRLRYYQESR